MKQLSDVDWEGGGGGHLFDVIIIRWRQQNLPPTLTRQRAMCETQQACP